MGIKYTEDEKFMKEALRQAKKAAAIEEVPIGCVMTEKLLQEVTIREIKKGARLPMRKYWPFKRPAAFLETGGLKAAQCM